MGRRPVDLGRTEPTCRARWHGTVSAYRWGCSCPHARNARRIQDKRRREGRHRSPLVDAVGTARRVRALCAMGWRYQDLAVRLGCTWQRVQQLALADSPLVLRTTAATVRGLCRQVGATAGPSAETARRSAAKGWHTLAAWDDIDNPAALPSHGDTDDDLVDEVAVRRAVHGDTAVIRRLTDAEREAAAVALLAGGVGTGTAAKQVGLSERRVRRLRAAGQLGEVAA